MSHSTDILDRQFEEFDGSHPEIWGLYVKFAKELRRHKTRGSSEQVIQRLRWETNVNPKLDMGYKIRNAFRKRYAEKLARLFPKQFGEFFRFVNTR